VAEGNHDAVAALYERRLGSQSSDPETRQQQYARLAEVHEVARADLNAAFAVWARALADAPDRADVQGQLERLAASRGTWDALAEIYEKRLHEVSDADLEHVYAAKLGSLYEEALGDLDRAAQRYKRALDVASDERPLLAALDRVYGRAGKFAELAEILVREADASNDGNEQAELWFRLGDVREQNLDDVAAAVGAYREVLDRAPRHSAARGALERLLAQGRERAEVINILEPLYEGEGDWQRLVDLLAAKLQVTEDHMDRAQVYARIAELAEGKLGDAVRALDAAGGWLAEDPASERALAEVERLAEACGRWDEVAARLAGIIETADSDEIKLPLLLELGEVEMGLRRSKEAEATFRRALAIDDESGPALASLDRIYRERGDAKALAEVVWRRGELAMDAPHKRRCFVEAATLREQLGDADGAITAWKEVLDLDESDRDAHVRLAHLYEGKQMWPELIDVLGIASRFATDKQEEAALRARAARIQVAQGNLDEAVDAWQGVLDVAPEDAEALAALLAVHGQREDWLAVQEVLTRKLELARSNPEKIAIYTELADLAVGKRDSVDEAIGYCYQILDIDNAHFATYQRLEQILTGAERWHDVVELMQRLAEVYGALGQTREEVGCYARAADIWEGPLDNPDAAGEILEKIIAREPRYVPALTRLAKIYESAGDWDKCSEVLQRAAAMGPTGADAADLYFRLGEVERQKTGDMEAALRHWAHALQFDPRHPQAVAAFEKEARDRDDWGVVADMVARREQSTTEPKAKLELLLELADIYGKKLGQPQNVVPLLERASQQAPTDPRVIGPLGDAYFAAGDIARAAPIFEKLAEEAKAGRRMKEVAMFRQRLGGIFEARQELDRALEAYEEAFRVNPTDVATMAGLGRIYMTKQDWEKARRVYRSLVLQNIDPGAGVTKAEVYYHLGMIHIHMGEAPKAKGMFQRGLELEPNNEMLKRALAQVG
jgi:tetratricopeptide (TPR) repeat protein